MTVRWGLIFIFVFGTISGYCFSFIVSGKTDLIAWLGVFVPAIMLVWSAQWSIWQQTQVDKKKSQEAWNYLEGVALEINENATKIKEKLTSGSSCRCSIICTHGIDEDTIKNFDNDSYLLLLDNPRKKKIRDFKKVVQNAVSYSRGGGNGTQTKTDNILKKCDFIISAYQKLISS